jgi:hypothetical protein
VKSKSVSVLIASNPAALIRSAAPEAARAAASVPSTAARYSSRLHCWARAVSAIRA